MPEISVTVDGEAYLLGERVERLIRWLLEQAEQINSLTHIQVTFSCKGKSIQTDLRIFGRT